MWLVDRAQPTRGRGLLAFAVTLPSGVRYWTVLDDDLAVVAEADAYLRHVRFGRDGSELTQRDRGDRPADARGRDPV